MKDQRKIIIKARGFQVNTNQRGVNEQQEGKECKTRRQEIENTKSTKCTNVYEIGLIWNILEVVRGEDPLS
jgi:hypothetical protein